MAYRNLGSIANTFAYRVFRRRAYAPAAL